MIAIPVLWLVLLLIFAVAGGFIAGWLLGADMERREIEAEGPPDPDAATDRLVRRFREVQQP